MPSPAFQRLPGFRDFTPEDFALRRSIFEAWGRVAIRYGFSEYDGPPLEGLDLYLGKSGEEIVSQLYNFEDKGGRQVSLRPEMTPSLARILGAHSRGMSKPIRWFSIPQLFRYERQQRGRLREHFQWNVDIVGEGGVLADVEVLAVAIDGLRELGLGAEDFCARVSDRRLLTAILEAAGVTEGAHSGAYAVIDKLGRAPRDASVAALVEATSLAPAEAGALLDLLASSDLDELVATYGERTDVAEGVERLASHRKALEAMGLGGFIEHDLTIVRGLAYYTGIVFELFDRQRRLRAICGGGRYDRLLEWVGGEDLPSVGFGMGDVVLGELLADRGLVPDYSPSLDYFLVLVGDEERALGLRLAHALRDGGKRVAFALRDQSVRKQFQAASTEGASEVIVLGPEEAARGVAIVRDMASGEEREMSLEDMIEKRTSDPGREPA